MDTPLAPPPADPPPALCPIPRFWPIPTPSALLHVLEIYKHMHLLLYSCILTVQVHGWGDPASKLLMVLQVHGDEEVPPSPSPPLPPTPGK